MDEKTWLVLPFENITHAPALDVVRDASVTLLYLEMSRWSDIRVVDDERVADLLRDVPEANRSQLGLQAGLALARRAGAGKLVLGDILKAATRTTLTAKVYSVRTGERVRQVSDVLTNLDSISVAFDHLAEQVVAVPSPGKGNAAGVGTSSVQALQAYTAGMQEMGRWRTDSAELHFREAARLDSTFALAHLRLGQVLGLEGFNEPARVELAAAERRSDGLPERDRLLIAIARGTALEQCAPGARLVQLDSADVDGWMAIGRCQQADRIVLEAGGRPRVFGNLNAALRASDRALTLQPTNVFAVASFVTNATLGALLNLSCSAQTLGPCPTDSLFVVDISLDGDTIAQRPELWREARFNDPLRRPGDYVARRALLTRVAGVFARWTSANPLQWRGHREFALVLLGTGDLVGARRELDAGQDATQLRGVRRTYYRDRIELTLREERPREGALLLDSMFVDPTTAQQPQFATAFGQFSRDQSGGPDSVRRLRTQFMQAFSGVVPPDYAETVRRFADTRAATAIREPSRAAAARQETAELGTILGFHSLRTGPALDTASRFSLLRYQSFFARGDTAKAREALSEYDAWAADGAPDLYDGHEMFSAESHLELGDTTAAWRAIEPFGRRWAGYWLFLGTVWRFMSFNFSPSRTMGRAWLLYADLAMATNHPAEAKRGYNMVVGLWEKGEPPVQPMVTRAKAALAKLGN